jgi:hypothetical protein
MVPSLQLQRQKTSKEVTENFRDEGDTLKAISQWFREAEGVEIIDVAGCKNHRAREQNPLDLVLLAVLWGS